jgi:ferredoxin
MRVYVRDDKCQGHTLCNAVAGKLFKLREEDGHSYVLQSEVPKELEEAARLAEAGCPERAIVVEDD